MLTLKIAGLGSLGGLYKRNFNKRKDSHILILSFLLFVAVTPLLTDVLSKDFKMIQHIKVFGMIFSILILNIVSTTFTETDTTIITARKSSKHKTQNSFTYSNNIIQPTVIPEEEITTAFIMNSFHSSLQNIKLLIKNIDFLLPAVFFLQFSLILFFLHSIKRNQKISLLSIPRGGHAPPFCFSLDNQKTL